MPWLDLEEDIAAEFSDQRLEYSIEDIGPAVPTSFCTPLPKYGYGSHIFRSTPRRVFRAEKIERRLCARCPRPQAAKGKFCEPCAEKNRARVRAYRKKNRAAGRCVQCGRDSVGRRYCPPHMQAHNSRTRAFKKMLAANQMCAKEGE